MINNNNRSKNNSNTFAWIPEHLTATSHKGTDEAERAVDFMLHFRCQALGYTLHIQAVPLILFHLHISSAHISVNFLTKKKKTKNPTKTKNKQTKNPSPTKKKH